MRYLRTAFLVGLSVHAGLVSLGDANSDASPIFLDLYSEDPGPLHLTPVEPNASTYQYSHEMINHDTGSSLTVYIATDGNQWGYALEYQRADPSDERAVPEPDRAPEDWVQSMQSRSDTISPEHDQYDERRYNGLGDSISDSHAVDRMHESRRLDDSYENHYIFDSLSEQELAVLSDMNALVGMFRLREQSSTYHQQLEMKMQRIKKSMNRAWFDHQVDMDMKLFVRMMQYGGLYQRLLTIHADDISKARYEFARLKRLWPWKHRNGFVNRTPCRKEASFIRFVGADVMRCAERCLFVRSKIVAQQQALPPKMRYQKRECDKKQLAVSAIAIHTEMPAELMDDIPAARISIIHALESCNTLGVLADRLEIISQEVFIHTTEIDYDLHRDIEAQVGNSISIIRASSDLPGIIYHVAVVDRVLTDLQMQMQSQPTLLERSPQLLARAAEKFVAGLNPIKQVKGMCEFLIRTAHFACDATLGKIYLSHDDYQARVKGFWDTIDALSPENLAQLSAENWIDIAAELAGGMVIGVGVYKTVTYLKEIEAASRAARQAAKIAGGLKKAIDITLGQHPILVTAEGILMRNYDKMEEVSEKINQIIKNADSLITCDLPSSHELSAHIIARTDNILALIKGPLENLVSMGNKIKAIGKDAFDVSHTFSPKHVESGILTTGKTAEEITLECIAMIQKADFANLLTEGTSNIQTHINGVPIEVRPHIQNGVLLSFNAFAGHSTRIVKNLIKF